MGLKCAIAAAVLAAGCVIQTLAYPIAPEDGSSDGWRAWWLEAAVGVAGVIACVAALAACVCCKRSSGFKPSDSGLQELGSSRGGGSSTSISMVGPREEFTMFPPPGVAPLSTSTTQINFEPLPDIRPRSGGRRDHHITNKTLPAAFPASLAQGLPTDEWFAEPHQNFPRNQLQYVKEIGKGWFGHVLEGRATGIFSDHTKGESPSSTVVCGGGGTRSPTPVAVKVLREDATPTEQMYFLHEMRPYRALSHPNLLRVLAHCLEAEPFLILLQLCPKGDLKEVLRKDHNLTEATLLRMALNVAAGLKHLHSYTFIHTDLAARNCLVDEDYTVKIGDYGYNIDFYKNEYYCAGEVALPLRWCAPETLKCTDTTIETKEVTSAANVWSFGVIMWEIASRGLLPYPHLDDDQVIQQVIVEQICLPQPPPLQLHADKTYNIMKLCWGPEDCRPSMPHIHSLLLHLWDNLSVVSHDTMAMSDFELRWSQLQQQQPLDHSIVHTGNTADLRFDSDFNLSSRQHFGGSMSPSLQNLHGSSEDLDAKMVAKFGSALPSWLGMEPGQPMDSLTREITDAILKLDDYLAGEKSEPSTSEASPEKGGVNFKVGKDSFVSNPPSSKLVKASTMSGEGSGHPSLTRTLSDGEDEGFTMRLEQGEFTEMVRLKSQSVQDFMKLTVVDDGSDSDNASQRNSLAFEPVTKPLVQEKSYSSEGNIREALRDVKFMGEIERLQAEHRYSIITEASREYASSIEYRIQDFDLDKSGSASALATESETGSAEKLTPSVDSDNSNIYSEKQNSEEDPFLDKLISSTSSEEKKSNERIDYSPVERKPLPASPDCVVSSRDPQPVALPDIVVHNSTVKLATPSPPPVSPPIFMNNEQPKEFRFIFGDGEVTESVVSSDETDSKLESIVFSDNMKKGLESSEKLGPNSEEEIVPKGDDLSQGKELAAGPTQATISGEETCKSTDLNKFLDYAQEKSRHRLTSTPLKQEDSSKLQSHSEDIDSSVFSENCIAHDSSYDGDQDTQSNVITEDNDSSKFKQRLVFGFDKNEVGNLENENEDDRICSENERKEEIVTKVPSYKPEEVVKGEDIVIGALEDYSLDLYRAVKSPDVADSQHDSTDSKEMAPEQNVTDVANLEVDLDQWDKFLGSTMNEDRMNLDNVFKEVSDDKSNIKSDLLSDILGSTFEQSGNTEEVNGKLLKYPPETNTHNRQDQDLRSTVESSIASKTCDIPNEKSGAISSTEGDSSVDVNTNAFSGLTEASQKEQITQQDSCVDDSSQQLHRLSDNSFFSAELILDTGETEESDLYNTAATEVSKDISEVDQCLVSSRDVSLAENSKSEGSSSIDHSYIIIDTPSASFTYRKEESIDCTLEIMGKKEVDYTEIKTDLRNDTKPNTTLSSAEDVLLSTNELKDIQNMSAQSNDKNDIKAANTTISSAEDVLLSTCELENMHSIPIQSNDNNELQSNGNNDSEIEEPDNTSKTIDASLSKTPISDGKNVTISKPVDVLSMAEIDCIKSQGEMYKDEDDLSPSAYQYKVGKSDGWSSQESQDSAVENDEAENGDFWQQQMVAWQEAAFQTKQLLQEAADGTAVFEEKHEASQDDIDASPRSDTSSSKSLYSSSDMLHLDDEGTYVSYNTTDDEEVLGYKPEDINALRAELSLKLGVGQENEPIEPEESEESLVGERDNVVINYRGIIGTTLSPIKEESFIEDDESPTRRQRNKSLEEKSFFEDSSIELSESHPQLDGTYVIAEAVNQSAINQMEPDPANSVFPSHQDQSYSLTPDAKVRDEIKPLDDSLVSDFQVNNVGKIHSENKLASLSDNIHDSLLLEDLEEESGPSSIQVYNSKMDANEDVLIVNMETNEATIVEGGKPRSHLAFITDEAPEPELTDIQVFAYEDSDDVAPESIPSMGGSRFDEVRHREQCLNNKQCGDASTPTITTYEGDDESKAEVNFLLNRKDESEGNLDQRKDLVNVDSPQGIQVPHYHSYFTSALSSISHPNASLEDAPMFEQVEHISLPYNVNYPAAGETVEDFSDHEADEGVASQDSVKESKENTEEDSEAVIKLNFLGRLYSDESEDGNDKSIKSHESREATLLSDSDGDAEEAVSVARPKTPEPGEINQMTSAQFLASEKYRIQQEDIEEHIEVESGCDDSDDSDDGSDQGGAEPGQDPRYTPDWETDSDSDGESSSTSGEFMWRQEDEKGDAIEEVDSKPEPGQPCSQSSYVLNVIEEEPGEEEEEDGEDGSCSEDSESGEEEFTPSKWNRELRPSRSLLMSPENRSTGKKSVRWKRQRHHRVYEYPPEPRSWEPTHHRRAWGQSSLDYLSLADWELGSDEFLADDSGDMEDYVYLQPSRPAPPPPIYTLGSVAYDDTSDGYLVDNGEFFIRSSASPFTFTSSSFSASDFFSGNHTSDYEAIFGGASKSSTVSNDTPTEPVDTIEKNDSNSVPDEAAPMQSNIDEDTSTNTQGEELEQSSPTNTVLGELRHTRDKLRLEIPSMSIASESAEGNAHPIENGQSNTGVVNGAGASAASISLYRTEPEVSEV